MFTSIVTVSLYAAALLQTGSAQRDSQALLQCRYLDQASQEFFFNHDYLSACGVLPEDRDECRRLTCSNTDTSRAIATLSLLTVPCGEGGRRQGLLVTATNFENETLFNQTLYETVPVLLEESMTLSLVVEQQANGIIFSMNLRNAGETDPNVIPTIFLQPVFMPMDSSEYSCPSVPNLAQPQATCNALNDAQVDSSLGSCTVNPSCLAAKCINVNELEINYYGLNIFPCAKPLAVQVLIIDAQLVAQVNVTVIQTTTGIPFDDDLLGNLSITLDVSADSFDITVERVPRNDPVQTYLSLTTIPISTSECSSEIRLAGENSPSSGRLEVFVDGRWGTVCSDFSGAGFSSAAADVACKQLLGLADAEYVVDSGHFARFSSNSTGQLSNLAISMSDVECSSSELRLQKCTFSRNTSACTHADNDVGLLCEIKRCDGNVIACSVGYKLAIAVGVIMLVLLIAVPVSICVCVRLCCGVESSGPVAKSSGPRQPNVVATTYNPAPIAMNSVI